MGVGRQTATWTSGSSPGSSPTPRFNADGLGHGSQPGDSVRRILLRREHGHSPAERHLGMDGTGTDLDGSHAGGHDERPSARMYQSATYDAAAQKTVLYGGNTGSGRAAAGTWVDETWEWDGTTGTWTKTPRPARTHPLLQLRFTWPTTPAPARYVLYYYEPDVGVRPDDAGLDGGHRPDPPENDTLPTSASRSSTIPRGRHRRLRRVERVGARRRGARRHGQPVDEPIDPVLGPDPAPVPSIAFDSKSATTSCSAATAASTPLQAGHLVGDHGTALTNRTTGDEAASAQPGRPDLRQQARSHAAVRRLRRHALDDLWGWDPTSGEWSQITYTGARPTALRRLDVL